MVVFLYRPSPQVPRPSTRAAFKCYDACQYNILMHREQMRRGNVETTWIFVQSIFMAVNTILWTLSYEEVRKVHPRSEVQGYLDVGLESISLSAERWPGAASAHDLYVNLIEAVMKIFEKDGDVIISLESQTVSPESLRPRSAPIAPLPESNETISPLMGPASLSTAPFGYIQPDDYKHPNQTVSSVGIAPVTPPGMQPVMPPPPTTAPAPTSVPTSSPSNTPAKPRRHAHSGQLSDSLLLPSFNLPPTPGSPVSSYKPGSSRTPSQSPSSYDNLHYFHAPPLQQPQPLTYDPSSPYNQLPTTFPELRNWSPNFVLPNVSPNFLSPTPYTTNMNVDTSVTSSSFENPLSSMSNYEFGTSPDTAMPNSDGTQSQQYQDYYPDPYWTAEMITQGVGGGVSPMYGNGLAVDQQGPLMQNLESIGPEQIERMIAESNAFFNSRSTR